MPLSDVEQRVLAAYTVPMTIQEGSHKLELTYHTTRRYLLDLQERNRVAITGMRNRAAIFVSVTPEMMPKIVLPDGNKQSLITMAEKYADARDAGRSAITPFVQQGMNMYPQIISYLREVMDSLEPDVPGTNPREVNMDIVTSFHTYVKEMVNTAEEVMRLFNNILDTDELFDPKCIMAFNKDTSWNPVIIKRAYNWVMGTKWYHDVPMADTFVDKDA